jgi:hypothetical protein
MDLLCYDDVDLAGREIDDPLAELEQDLVHVAFEAPGSNLDDLERGVGLRDRLSGVADPKVAQQLDAAWMRDDRVTSSKTAMAETAPGEFALDAQVQVNGTTLKINLDVAQQEGRIQ